MKKHYPTKTRVVLLAATIAMAAAGSICGMESGDTSRGDRMISAYFQSETRKLAEPCLADVKTAADWNKRRDSYRQQLREMLGLDPLPERTPLRPVVTGSVDHEKFTVEKLHFQSRPQLYVTANLYVPKGLSGPAPAILYLCGHSPAKKNGVSYGNKTKYQHHAGWFARNGYVCLVIDSLQLGEIEGIHHGTYRENMWWWNARGYTPAGAEAWNAIRAIDYLESRPEVDAQRIGVTGRSGGGAYTWWVAALDDRVKVAVPVAGITNLKNHVIDGCVEGHCDCMYVVNTYRWDYAQVAALVAPRPLLMSNTDQDPIFPLDGVIDIYEKIRPLYQLHGKPDDLGLHIAAGAHDDTQVLQTHAFQWFNKHLQGVSTPINGVAEDFFTIDDLKVFDTLPADEINSRLHEQFTSEMPVPKVPATSDEYASQCSTWRRELREKSFGGWPEDAGEHGTPPQLRPVFQSNTKTMSLRAYDFVSQNDIELRLFLAIPANALPAELDAIVLRPLDSAGWSDFVAAMRVDFAALMSEEPPADPSAEKSERIRAALSTGNRGLAFVAPRGIGPTAWNSDAETHIRRRFMLLGQTLDGMRVWDTRRAIQALRSLDGVSNTPVWLDAERDVAAIALYAALFEPRIARLDLRHLPKSHQQGPDFLNVLRFMDVPQAVAMALQNSDVHIYQEGDDEWSFPLAVADKLGWKNRLMIRPISPQDR